MPSRCWVIGSAVLDTVYSVDRLPTPGESVLANKVEQFIGGKGVNQAVACGRSGAETHIIACLGFDDAGTKFLETFIQENLGTNRIFQTHEAPTGQAAITLAANGKNQITVFPGSNMHLPVSLVEQAPINEEDFTICQFEVPDDVIIAASKRGKFILNPAPYRSFPRDVLKNCLAITPNETEATALTGIIPDTARNIILCAKKLLALGPQNAIITLGERGAYYRNRHISKFYVARKIEPVDSTGAGDVFNGALIARLSLGDSFDQAIPYAVAAATLSVTIPGAVPSIPKKCEILKFMSG
jgi:ribokinase